MAACHALSLAGLVYRALTWCSLSGVVLESARASAVTTLLLAGSFMLSYAFTAEGVPQAMAQWVEGPRFLLLVSLLFRVLGSFLDVSVLLLAMTVFPHIVR